jgi:formylglycine-generating enzyme required for sulfatase activity
MRTVVALVLVGCGRIDFDATRSDAVHGTCADLPETCGPSGSSSCCASIVVPGGMFLRGYDVAVDGAYKNMSNPATVSDFRFDTYEATVGRFRQFVDAGMGTQQLPPAPGAGARVADPGGWDPSWNANLAPDTATLVARVAFNSGYGTWSIGNDSLPINQITWYEAFAFCVWDGGFLPTEAEWYYAAAGGNEQRAFPWSNPPGDLTINCSYANYFYMNTTYCVNPPAGAANSVGSESPMGDGKWGHVDLAGNVFEWTLDGYAPYANPCIDCAQLTTIAQRVSRGGYFAIGTSNLRVGYREPRAPMPGDDDIGVRCARPP